MLTSRWFGGTPTTSLPYSRICPSVGSSKPPIIRRVVVLPHPDGPSREKNSPSPMVRSTRSTAATVPRREWKVLATPTSSIARVASGSAVDVLSTDSAGCAGASAFGTSMHLPEVADVDEDPDTPADR